jgi:D-3-phosphoglycerate dehydrogenase
MSDTIEPLLIDMLEWIAKEERPYAEVMEVWRTSCPRLPVWEEANARELLTRRFENGTPVVRISEKGTQFLAQKGRT